MYHMAKKRWLACVLALVMLLSVLPVAAMAAEPVLDGAPAAAQQTEEETPAPAPEQPQEPEQPEQSQESEQPQEPEQPQQPEQPQPQLEAEGEENAPVVMAAGTYYWAIVNSGSDVKLVISDSEYKLADGETAYPVNSKNQPTSGTFTGNETSGERAWYNYCNDITTAVVVGNVAPTSTRWWFYDCSKLTSVDLGGLDTSNVTTMFGMFRFCTKLTEIKNANWQTGKVTTMATMFYSCEALPELDCSNWDVSNVTTMKDMFWLCKKLTTLNVSGWKIQNTTNMSGMFSGCHKLTALDISTWNVSGVTDMSKMFSECDALASLKLSGCDFSAVTTFENMLKWWVAGKEGRFSAIDLTGVKVPANNVKSSFNLPSNTIAYVSTADSVKTTAGGEWLTAYDGAIAVTNGGTFRPNTSFEKGKLAAPNKEGYIFAGWYDKADCTGTAVTSPAKGTTYYAKWELKPQPVYVFMLTRYNNKAAVVDDAAVQRLGISYNGSKPWATIGVIESDVLPATATKGQQATSAQWDAVLAAIKDNGNFSNLTQFGGTGYNGAAFHASNLSTATLNALKWGAMHYNGGTSLAYTADTDLVWKFDSYLDFVKVTFDYNDGKTASTTGDYAVGESVTLPTPADREGYTFNGWKANGTAVATASYAVGDADVTLQAQWTPIPYDVTFDPANGEKTTTEKVNYGDSIAKPADPTKTGYTFDGWYNGKEEWKFDKDTMGAANMTLTAHWTINQYEVTFDPANGEKTTTTKVNYNEKADKPADPTRSGYVFDGWYNGSQKFDFSSPITGNVTLTAKWHLKTNNIGPAKNPYIKDDGTKPDTKTDGKTVKSGNTFDAGIGLYVGMSLLSLTGSALVVTKKKRG